MGKNLMSDNSDAATKQAAAKNERITHLEKTNKQLLVLNDYLIHHMNNATVDIAEYHFCIDKEPVENRFELKNGREMDWTCSKCGYHSRTKINANYRMGEAPESLK